MEQHVLTALGGRDVLPGKQYLLLRVTPGEDVVVNVITVETRPVYNRERGESEFMASCQFIFDRALSGGSEDEGDAIELTLSDIGCGRNGPAEGVLARTFPYGEVEHQMLATVVRDDPDEWRRHLKNGCFTIDYTVAPRSEYTFAQSFEKTAGATALSSWLTQ